MYLTYEACTEPMYPVPYPCTKNVVPILAADLVEIAADLVQNFWYMGTVQGTWVRYMVHGYGTSCMGHGAYICCNGTRCYSTLERARVHLRFVPLR